MFKTCAPFTDCISEINNTIKMYIYCNANVKLIEYSNNYSGHFVTILQRWSKWI